MAGPSRVRDKKTAVVKGENSPADVGPVNIPKKQGQKGSAVPVNLQDLPAGWNEKGFPVGYPVKPAKVNDVKGFRTLIFNWTQQILQKPGETTEQLHERLRERATNSIFSIREPTRIVTPTWLTVDVSKILNIQNAVLISTSTCVHELPARIFIGIKDQNWMRTLPDGRYQYILHDLGRELTPAEKNALYDAVRANRSPI